MSVRCVVTGGAGVIGHKLVELLVARGNSVRVVDLVAPTPGTPQDVDYVQGDLAQLGPMAISDFDPDVVFHLAAAFERSDEQPDFWRENAHHNIEVSRLVLEGATRSPRLRRYVFASSYLIYDPDLYLCDEPPDAPSCLREDSMINPRNVCGAAKLLHEREIELASRAVDAAFSTVSARIYRVYGRGSRDIVSRWIRAALRGETLHLYGAESMFDYVFADDVAEGLLRLGDADITGVVNLASGRSRRVGEVIECIGRHLPGLEVEGPYPSETYERSEAIIDRLHNATGWTPPTSLEQGVSELVKYETANLRDGTISRRTLPTASINVLVSSLSSKASVVRASRDAYQALNLVGLIWGADADQLAPARQLVDRFWNSPRLGQIDDDAILKMCATNGIRLLIPTRDGELGRFSALRDRLAAVGTFVPVGSPDSIATMDDKLAFARACELHGLSVVATSEVVEESFGDRLVVKPRCGAGSQGIHLDVARDRASQLVGAAPAGQLVVQPWFDVPEFSIDLYVRSDGLSLGAVVRERKRVVAGESVVTQTVDRPDVADLALKCAAALGVRGHAVFQALDTSEGPKLLECNPRVGGASAASWAAGLRSVDAMFLEALGLAPEPFRIQRTSVRTIRLPIDFHTWR